MALSPGRTVLYHAALRAPGPLRGARDIVVAVVLLPETGARSWGMQRSASGLSRWLGAVAMMCTFASPAWSGYRPDDPEARDLKVYEQEVLARMSAASNRRGARPM